MLTFYPLTALRSVYRLSFILLVCSVVSLTAFPQGDARPAATRISGKLLGGDGKPMQKAFVALSRGYTFLKMVAVTEVDEHGNYTLSTEKKGLFYLIYRGVNNQAELVPLMIDKPRNVRIDVKLSVPAYNLDAARISRDALFKKQPDGTYVVEAPSSDKQFRYVVNRGYKIRGAMQGTDPGPVEMDPSGMLLWKIATPVDGKVTIHIDPAKLPRPSGPTEVKFSDPRSADARLYDIYREMNARNAQEFPEFDPKPRTASDAEISELLNRIDKETIPLLQKALWLSYIDLTVVGRRPEPATLRKALDAITSTSPVWVLGFYDLPEKAVAAAKEPTKYSNYLREIASIMPADDRVGKPVPTFTAASFDDANVLYTDANFKGKVYLIDFWATWCGPCLGQMPYLQRAYEKYHSKGFEILSYSVDSTRQAVIDFRKRKGLQMPWLHAIDPQLTELGGDIPRRFNVSGIPAQFLVDAQGKIIATTDDLQGPGLEKALESAFATMGTPVGGAARQQ